MSASGRDWYEWHGGYDDPASGLGQRLHAVQRQIAEALERAPAGPVRAVSMCAGQGRDLLGVLADHPRRADVHARLVELDPRNAEVATTVARGHGLDQVEVVVGDASVTDAYAGAVPADLVLACGIFGQATDDDIHHMIEQLPALCAPGATVIWTRGWFGYDLRPAIRAWFAGAGFEEVAFETGDDGSWGIGAARLVGDPRPYAPGTRLFHFLDRLPSP